ncbi:MAG: inorganic diphosphatase [Fibrella sp.]|nr:inorganic diphosphatase [Armatimonadota bacterium]
MPFRTLPIGDKAPEEINAVIEIPRGSSNKYEYDKELGVFRLDRPMYSPLFYPFDYGWVPETLSQDGDALDVLVIGSHPTFPGCVVTCRPLGVLMMRDDKGPDEKVLARVSHDPRYHGVRRLSHVAEHVLREIEHFFQVYKTLEEKEVEIGEWRDVEAARELITQSRVRKEPV